VPSTSASKKGTLPEGASVLVVSRVTGGSWSTDCAGDTASGNDWFRIGYVTGKSVSSRYGVTYVYAATSLLVASVSTSETPTVRLVTASLTVDFAGSAKVGEWIETRVDIQRLGKTMGFANAYLHVNERRIVRASAVFARASEGEP